MSFSHDIVTFPIKEELLLAFYSLNCSTLHHPPPTVKEMSCDKDTLLLNIVSWTGTEGV